MAEPLGRAGSIRLAEDAFQLLRQTPAATLVCHAIGSVPFALAVLLVWNDATNTHTADLTWAGDSLALALLLLWMNCWRSVYAGRLRHQLSGAADRPWTSRRIFHLIALHSFHGAVKLIVWPLAALIVFPTADTVAFYRYLAVLAGRDESSPREIVRQARRFAGMKKRENWGVLLLLMFLQLIVTLNVAIVLGTLPQLVRVLTGYESTYSRSGWSFVANPFFVLIVLAVTWIIFDPFAQAVYTMRCFQAESMETGEDLRCGLRRIRLAGPLAAAILVLFVATPYLRAEVTPPELEQSIRQTMQSHEYDWRFPPASQTANTPWIVGFTDRVVAAWRRAMHAAGDAVDRFFRWLAGMLPGSVPSLPGVQTPGVSWVVALLILIVVAAGAVIAWQMRRTRPPTEKLVDPMASVRLDAPDLTADLLPEESWIALAERSLAEQNFRFALRAFYLASLAWLGRQEYLRIHPGKTDSEYDAELRRRTHGLPDARALFGANIAAFARAWYGWHEVSADDIARFRERTESLKTMLAPAREIAA